MRWLLFATCFFIVVFISFWTYVWNYRADLVQNGLERACPHYSVAIGGIEMLTPSTWIIQHIAFTDIGRAEKPSIRITQCSLSVPVLSWLQWSFIPMKSALVIEHATVTFSQISPFVLETPKLYAGIRIRTLTILWPDGTSSTFTDVQGSVSEILNRVLETKSQ